MLINNKIFKEEGTLNKLLENAKIFNKRLKFFDLDLVNITCNRIKELPLRYCLLQSLAYNKNLESAKEYSYLKDLYSTNDFMDAKSSPAIIHYAGKPGKPWRMKKTYIDYQEYINKLPKNLQKYTFREVRKKLFSKV